MNTKTPYPRRSSVCILRSLASLLMAVPAVAQLSFTQPGGITINDYAAASPYPSKLVVSGVTGTIEKVSVTLANVIHGYPADIGAVLVSPDVTQIPVALMGGAGYQYSLNGITFTLDDTAASALPSIQAINNGGVYIPTNYIGVNLANFVVSQGGPAGPYSPALGSLDQINPNGTWQLFVVDDQPINAGSIGAWTLNLWATPTLTPATNSVTVNENTPQSLNVAVASATTNAASLTLSARSVNPTLVSDTNLVVGGSGGARTLTITPNLNAFGTTTLALTLSDEVGSVTTNINLQITYVPQPPTLSLSMNAVTTLAGVVTTNSLVATVGDPETRVNDLKMVAVASSNTNVVTTNGVFFSGAGAARTFSIAPNGLATGKSTVTIGVLNGHNLSATATIDVTVNPLGGVNFTPFANAQGIQIKSAAASTPSTIAVSGVSGLIGKVTVSLTGLSNAVPADVDLVLTAPGGISVSLLKNGSTGKPAANFAQLTFDDAAAGTPPPADPVIQSWSLPPNQALSALIGSSPNGTWTLSVNNGSSSAGAVAGGWILNIAPAPTIPTVGDQKTPENTDLPVSFAVGDTYGTVTNVTAQISIPALATVKSATIANNTVSLVLSPQPNANSDTIPGSLGGGLGIAVVTVVVQDTSNFTATNTFNFRVAAVNDAPTISAIPKFVTPVGVPTGANFTVASIDWPVSSLVVTATSSNPKVLPNDNIVLGGSGNNRTITVYPADTQSGSAVITVVVTDPSGTATASNSLPVSLTVTDPNNPVFGNGQSPITINNNTNASPYPSQIAVSGLVSKVAEVKVTLFDITHPQPTDINALLVDPTGQAVLLMGHAGGNSNLASVTLVFADSASNSLPQLTNIVSGTYQPTSYGTQASFGGPPPPAGPYRTSLGSAFNGTDPNGTWSLYIKDDALGPKGGVVNGGWQLSIRTVPQISSLPDLAVDETIPPLTSKVSVPIGDVQNGVNFTVTANSGNAALVLNDQAHLQVTGSGQTRTLLITPVAYQSGNSVITVVASDGVSSSTQAFKFTVNHVNQAPVISQIASQTGVAGVPMAPVAFGVWDADSPNSSIQVIGQSTVQSVIPNSNIQVNYLGGTNYSLSLTPAGVATGETAITIVATDGNNNKATQQFTVTVNSQLAFANGDGSITIPVGLPVQGTSTPYPSTNIVSGVNGQVSKASVALVGLTHPYPQDLVVLLVPPDNSKGVVLMGHAGGSTPANELRLTFADSAATAVPTNALSSGTFKPADYTTLLPSPNYSGALPAPAPQSNYSTNLSSLVGVSPNGAWKLYVLDDTFPQGGSIDGWILYLETSPTIGTIGLQITKENTPLMVPFTLSDSSTDPTNLVVTPTVSGNYPANLVTVNNLVVTTNGFSRSLTITPTLNLPSAVTLTNSDGTNLITLTVTGGKAPYAVSFPLTVEYVNQPPTITTATNALAINQNGNASINFTIGDVDSTVGSTTNVTVQSSNPNLVPNGTTNIVTTGGTATPGTFATANVAIYPVANQSGSTVLTVSVSDLINPPVTTTVTLTVTHIVQPPTIATIADQTVIAGNATTNIIFQVNDLETPPQSLVVTATSDKQALVPNSPANIIIGRGSDVTLRTIQLVPVGSTPGTANITVTVTNNGSKTASTTFKLTVTPAPISFFANSQVITIRDTNSAQPYPSVINVSSLVGSLYHVSVSLQGFGHGSPDDVDVVLVSPTGKAVMLMSDTGGHNAVTNLTLTFDDSGVALPSATPIVSGTYSPTDYNLANDSLPPDALLPVAPYATSLSSLNGANANGAWSLYVNDHAAGGTGLIASGWSLNVTTTPTIAVTTPTPPNALVMNEDSIGTIRFTVSDSVTPPANLALSYTSDHETLVPLGTNVVFAPDVPGGNAYTAKVYPAALQHGTNNLILTVTRSDGASASATVPMQVNGINYPPAISRLLPVEIPADTTASVEFLVTDRDTPMANLSLLASSSNPALIASTNILIGGTTNFAYGLPASGLVKLTLVPNAAQYGLATITVTLTDTNVAAPNVTNVVTSSFLLTVDKVNHAPTIAAIGDQVVVAGNSTTNISFKVGDIDMPPQMLTVTASYDSTVVKGVVITPPAFLAGAYDTRTVQVTTLPGAQQGMTKVTLTVSDGSLGNNSTFNLNVRPSRQQIFANNSKITIVDHAPANPYPSQIIVSNFNGQLSKVTVTLNGFAHQFPSDVSALLVHPDGVQKVLLMRRAGAGVSVTNLSLTFDASVEPAIPSGTGLSSGSFRPANYDSSSTYTFPSPAPGSPYSTDLTKLSGSPNGAWSLYVTDDTPSDSGVINNGWSIAITTTLNIQGLADQTTPENTPIQIPFTIADDQVSGPPTYTFMPAPSSSNSSVVSNSGLAITGSGTNYTLTVSPNQYASGSAKITITANNPDGQTATATFTLNVTHVNQPPVITQVTDQTITAGGAVTVTPFVYSDVETQVGDLQFAIQSSNPAVLPMSNIALVGNGLRIVSLGTQTGTSQVTLTVTDAGGLTASTVFNVNVLPSPIPVFASTNGIVINDDLPATPYPSTIDVEGVSGHISKVTVTFNGFTHHYPSDVSALLVGPLGQNVVLMSRASTQPASNVRLTLDDAASSSLPQTAAITDGTYKPTDYRSSDSFFPNAPAGPYSKVLSAFNGTSPVGTWSLYVQDDVTPDSGVIAGGWTLSIVTDSPLIAPIAAQTMQMNSTSVLPLTVITPVSQPTNLTLTATAGGNSPSDLVLPAGLVLGGTGTNLTLSITPTPGEFGTSLITVTVTDGVTTNASSFPLTVQYEPLPPVIRGLAAFSTPANIVYNQSFTVTSPVSGVTGFTVVASTADPKLGTISVTGTNSDWVLTYNPAGSLGSTIATVIASDGQLQTTNTYAVTVTAAVTPTIPAIADVTIPAVAAGAAPVAVPFTVLNALSGNPTVTASATNPNLVAGVSVTQTGGTNYAAQVSLVPYADSTQVGPAVITLVVTDVNGSGTNSFNLTVTPTEFPPVLGPIADQHTSLGVPVTVPLVVASPATALSNLTFSAISSNTKLVPVQNVSFTVTGNQATATITPMMGQTGASAMTFTVSDGTSDSSQNFVFFVTAPTPPVLGPISEQSTKMNVPVSVPLVVTSPDTSLDKLTFSGTSSSAGLVSGITFANNGTNVVATVNLVTNQTGLAAVTISVSDGINAPSVQSFDLNVQAGKQPTLSASFNATTGKFTISIAGDPNTAYVISETSDFKTWSMIATVTTDATGAGQYVVTVSGSTYQFYRVSAQ